MKIKKIFAMALVICIALVLFSSTTNKTYASSTTVKLEGSQLIKNSDNCITVSLKNNDLKVGGVEFFIAFNTQAFSVKNIVLSLPNTWELDWIEKNDEQYGQGILCMVQDSSLKGVTEESQELVRIILEDKNPTVGTKYEFKMNVIDVCDENGDTINALIKSEDAAFDYVEGEQINVSGDVNIEGFQISHVLGGIRTISSVEPQINGKTVVEYGNIYGLVTDGISAKDLYIGNRNSYVAFFKATQEGVIQTRYSNSNTAINYVRTMKNNGGTSAALTQRYLIRAYAKLEDGTYLYSNAHEYSIFAVAKVLYDHSRMLAYTGHEYLYDNILNVVEPDYPKVQYNWNKSVANF